MFRKVMVRLVVLLAIVLAGFLVWRQSDSTPVSQRTSSSVIQSIEQVKQVVFLNVGIQRVETQKKNAKLFSSFNIPFSEKRSIIILNYQAKLGISRPVAIKKLTEQRYRLTVPKFEVLGIEPDKVRPYQLYDTSGALLSGLTENIDTGELVAKSLTTKEQAEYLEKYQEDLRESAQAYYETLFTSIAPDSQLEFVFQ